MVAFVRLLRIAEPRELAHGPEPVAVAARVDAAGVGIFARVSEVAREIEIRYVLGAVERLERDIGDRAVGSA